MTSKGGAALLACLLVASVGPYVCADASNAAHVHRMNLELSGFRNDPNWTSGSRARPVTLTIGGDLARPGTAIYRNATNGLSWNITTLMDENSKTYLSMAFDDFGGVKTTGDTHRIVGHWLLDEPLPASKVLDDFKETFPELHKAMEAKYGQATDQEILERLNRIRKQLLCDVTTWAQARTGLPAREARAFAMAYCVDNHLIGDLTEKVTKDGMVFGSTEKNTRFLQDLDQIVANKKKNITILHHGNDDATKLCARLDDLLRQAKRVGGNNPQRVATYFADHVSDLGASDALNRGYSRNQSYAFDFKYTPETDIAKPLSFKAGSVVYGRYVAKKYGGLFLADAAVTLGVLALTGERDTQEYLKQGTSIAVASVAAWGTETVLLASGATAGYVTSTSALWASLAVLSPIPIGGTATLAAAGVYLATRWVVCASWDAVMAARAAKVEAQCRAVEQDHVSRLRAKVIERNTQQLQSLLEE